MLITNLTFVFHPTFGRSWVVTGVPHFEYMRYHGTWGMFLVDLNESYQNIPKSSHIARKKVPLLWGQKWCFFSFATKRHLGQSREEPYINSTKPPHCVHRFCWIFKIDRQIGFYMCNIRKDRGEFFNIPETVYLIFDCVRVLR